MVNLDDEWENKIFVDETSIELFSSPDKVWTFSENNPIFTKP